MLKFSTLISIVLMLIYVSLAHVRLQAKVTLQASTNDKIVFSMSPDGCGNSPQLMLPDDACDTPDEIFTMNPDSSDIQQLTSNEVDDSEPIWSPDLTKIAFLSARDGNEHEEVYVMNADGTNPIRLTNNNGLHTDLAWSGNKIAFRTSRDGNSEISVMNDDGSSPINLTNNNSQDYQPAWSPNGQKIAFISDRGGFSDLYVMNVDGSSPVRLTTIGASDYSPSTPQWSPDGSMIAFRNNPNLDLYKINADGTNMTQITVRAGGVFSFAWLANNNQIAY